jgi:hypothetical protein
MAMAAITDIATRMDEPALNRKLDPDYQRREGYRSGDKKPRAVDETLPTDSRMILNSSTGSQRYRRGSQTHAILVSVLSALHSLSG